MSNKIDARVKMENSIMLLMFYFTVCYKAQPTLADDSIILPSGRSYRFPIINDGNLSLLHVRFQSWAAASILRDVFDNFSIYLMELYEQLIEENPNKTFSTSLKKFERAGIQDQLKYLAKDFAIDPILISYLVSYNKARNCLSHRQGIVSSADATDDNQLVIRWIINHTKQTNSVDDAAVETKGPMAALIQAHHISGPPMLHTIEEKERRIPIGHPVDLLPDEIFGILETILLATAAFSGLLESQELKTH